MFLFFNKIMTYLASKHDIPWKQNVDCSGTFSSILYCFAKTTTISKDFVSREYSIFFREENNKVNIRFQRNVGDNNADAPISYLFEVFATDENYADTMAVIVNLSI